MYSRYTPKHFGTTLKQACKYCRKMPSVWHYVGNERICVHCGTRVYNASMAVGGNTGVYAKVNKDQ